MRVKTTWRAAAVVVAAMAASASCRQTPPAAPPPVPVATPAASGTAEPHPAPAAAADGLATSRNRGPEARGDVVTPDGGVARGAEPASARRDLAKDEQRGGHTIARHVGRTDEQLRQRLRAERSLSVASTYTDLATAEVTVARAFAASAGEIRTWSARRGRRPNLAVDFTAAAPVGRSLRRNAQASSPCAAVVVVLRWDERRNDSYVLTSYPDCRR